MKEDQSRKVFPAIEDGSPEPRTSEQAAKAEPTGEEIRERMVMVRRHIEEQSDKVIAQTEALSDWRTYVRRYPWLSVTAAAALGFAIVPRRAKAGSRDLPRNNHEQSPAFGAVAMRAALLGAAQRAAMAYASKTLGTAVGRYFAGNGDSSSAADGEP